MESIFDRPLLSKPLINYLTNTDDIQLESDKLISMCQLIEKIIITELLAVGLDISFIQTLGLPDLDINKIIEDSRRYKSKRILVVGTGTIKVASASYFHNKEVDQTCKIVIPIENILKGLYINMGLTETSNDLRLYALSKEDMREFFPEEQYSEEEFEKLVEGIRLLTTCFFDKFDMKEQKEVKV